MILVLSLYAMGLVSAAAAHQANVIELVTQKKVKELPAGPLFWQIQEFPTLSQAKSASFEMSIALEAAGKGWLFTLGPMGGSCPGGSKLAEIGPVQPAAATEDLLRVSWVIVTPGSTLPVHTHRGSEAFYVLAGRLGPNYPARYEASMGRPSHKWTGYRGANGSFQ